MADGKRPAFSMVWDTVICALGHSKASASDITVLLALMKFQGDGGELSRPSSEIAECLGMEPAAVRRALARLTRLEYTRPDGKRETVLTQTGRGHRGRTATYRLNVPREW